MLLRSTTFTRGLRARLGKGPEKKFAAEFVHAWGGEWGVVMWCGDGRGDGVGVVVLMTQV